MEKSEAASRAVLWPDVLAGYRCKCADCRRTCCRGDWDVVVSERELNSRLAGELGSRARELARECLERRPDVPTGRRSYRCRMRADGRCSALTLQGLCGWQVATGSCAGRVCDEFPRAAVEFRGRKFVSATLACEAVVESLVRHAEPVELVQARPSGGGASTCRSVSEPSAAAPTTDAIERALDGIGASVVIDEVAIGRRPLLGQYPLLVRRCVEALQDRDIRLGDRVALVMRSMLAVDELERSGMVARVPATLDVLASHGGRLRGLADLGEPFGCDAALLTLVVRVLVEAAVVSAPLGDACLGALRGLGLEVRRAPAGKLAPGAPDGEKAGLRFGVGTPDPKRLAAVRAALACETCDPEGRYAAFFEHLAVMECLRCLLPISGTSVAGCATKFACWFVTMALFASATLTGEDGRWPEPGATGADGLDDCDRVLVDAVVLAQRAVVHTHALEGLAGWLAETGLSDARVVIAMARSVCA
jgi:hypothetical protein